MAAGPIGLGRPLSIEAGTGTEEDKTFYRTWLSRIEGWSSSEKASPVVLALHPSEFGSGTIYGNCVALVVQGAVGAQVSWADTPFS
jgi:hypothetical protein